MKYLLTAHTAEGELVILTRSQSLKSLREWRKQESFYCPQCKELLLLKVGDVVIPHFSHYQQSSCRDSFSEGESPAHLLGKRHLYDLFSRHTPDVKLEPFLRDIQQRPDLLVRWSDTEVPVEFQCSTIPISLVQQRNAGYYLLNMLPVWIILTPHSVHTSSSNTLTLRLSSFLHFFIRPVQDRMSVLLTYHPQSETFHYLSPIIHLQGSTYATRHLTMSLHKQTVPFSLPSAPSQTDIRELTLHYQSARRKYLRNVIVYNQKGIHNQFLRACYEMRIQPVQLPAWIGIPVQWQEAFRQSDCEWQLLLVAAVRETRKSAHQLDLSFFQTFIKKFEGEQADLLAACRSYVDFLRAERIDIYRMDRFTERNYVYQVLSGRFLAKHAKN